MEAVSHVTSDIPGVTDVDMIPGTLVSPVMSVVITVNWTLVTASLEITIYKETVSVLGKILKHSRDVSIKG